jgi:hypothetical protein
MFKLYSSCEPVELILIVSILLIVEPLVELPLMHPDVMQRFICRK